MVPPRDKVAWPSLGPLVCDWIEENLTFGPGDLLGEPAKIDAEKRALIRRMYEIHPRGTAYEGRRRFVEAGVSMRKGLAKTELAAWITICEAHPDAPVRFVEWLEDGSPWGDGIEDPYIPLLATTEGQSEVLTYDAVKSIIERSAVRNDFIVGFGRITRTDGRGRIEATTAMPDTNDGKRTTFQVFDEPHRLTSKSEREAVKVMRANMGKRQEADPWTMSTTTAYQPGEGSVAEDMMEEARQIEAGKVHEPTLFFFHRQANDGHDFEVKDPDDPDDVARATDEFREALKEATGPGALAWANIEGIVRIWAKHEDDSYMERVYLNRPTLSNSQVFDMDSVRAGRRPKAQAWPRDRSEVVLGFDGSRIWDSTAIVGTELESGYQFVVGYWERPEKAGPDFEIDGDEVNQAFVDAMRRWRVKKAFCDRNFWETYVDLWAGKWPKIVVSYKTSSLRQTALDVRSYRNAWSAGEITFDGHPEFERALANARRKEITSKDDDGNPLWIMVKESKTSTKRIDVAYSGMLSWAARAHAIQHGALKRAGSKAGRTTVYMG
jgi:hypothetical protein